MAYSKKTWNENEVITKAALDNIETGIATNDSKNTQQDSKISTIEGKVIDATTAKKGIVKQSIKVDDVTVANATNASAATPTQEEFNKVVSLANDTKTKLNSLIAALKTAGIMANS